MVCCDSISHAEQISRISPRPTWTRSLYGSINVHGRPWDSKLLPIDYEWCCSDQLNPPSRLGHSAMSAQCPVCPKAHVDPRSRDVAQVPGRDMRARRARSPINSEQPRPGRHNPPGQLKTETS